MELTLIETEPSRPPGQCRATSRVTDGKRWREVPARDQLSFQVRRTEDLVAPDDPVRDVDLLLSSLEYLDFEIRHPGGGCPTWHPSFLCKLLVYGASVGVHSAREISRRLEWDLRFMWLGHEQRVDHEVLSRFRSGHKDELAKLFKQVVRLAIELGLVSLAHVATDGTKLAAAARRSTLSQQDLDKAMAELDKTIADLLAKMEAVDAAEDEQFGHLRGDEIEKALTSARDRRAKLQAALTAKQASGADRVSVTDPEAPLMKTQDGKRPGYNGQISVDADNGVVVAQALTTDQNDTQQFAPMSQQVTANTGLLPDAESADGGFSSAEALYYVEEQEGRNVYIRQQAVKTDGRYGHDDFAYDETTDTYLCPAGRRLVYVTDKKMRENKICRCYRVTATCSDCELRDKCLKPEAKFLYRSILVLPHDRLLRQMRVKTETEEGKQALKMRSSTVERVFGTIKAAMGFRQFLLRGLDRATCQFTLAVIAYNVRILVSRLRAQAAERLPQAAEAA